MQRMEWLLDVNDLGAVRFDALLQHTNTTLSDVMNKRVRFDQIGTIMRNRGVFRACTTGYNAGREPRSASGARK